MAVLSIPSPISEITTMLLIGDALDQIKHEVFSVEYVTHDTNRQTGGEKKLLPEVMLLNRKNVLHLNQLMRVGGQQHILEVPDQAGAPSKAPERPRSFVNVLVLNSGLPTSYPPKKICIFLITAINGIEIVI